MSNSFRLHHFLPGHIPSVFTNIFHSAGSAGHPLTQYLPSPSASLDPPTTQSGNHCSSSENLSARHCFTLHETKQSHLLTKSAAPCRGWSKDVTLLL